MTDKTNISTDLLTTSIKSSLNEVRVTVDEQASISNIHRLLGQGADMVSVNLVNGSIVVKGSKDGRIVSPATIKESSSSYNLGKLSGLKFDNNETQTLVISDSFALISKKETLRSIKDAIEKENALVAASNTSSGIIFIASKNEMHSIAALDILNSKVQGSRMYASFGATGWSCFYEGKRIVVPDHDSLISLVEAMSIRTVSIISTNLDVSIFASYKLSRSGVLVYTSVITQSSVHLLSNILSRLSNSEVSQSLIGVLGIVEVPTFDTSRSKKVIFSECNLYEGYYKYDASPMPEDLVSIVSEGLNSSSSLILTDYIPCPKNPDALKNEAFTVMDVYSFLRMNKWESTLDKSMPYIKDLSTGLNIIDKYIGKI